MSFNRTFARDAFIMSVLFLGARAVAALVPVYMAHLFGISAATDVFFLSYSFLFFTTGVLSQTLTVVVVPHFLAVGPSRADVEDFVGAVFIWTTAASAVAILLIVGGVAFLGPALGRTGIADVAGIQKLLLTGAPLIVFSGWASVFAGLCNARKKFVLPALSQILKAFLNLLVIFMFWRRLGMASGMVGYVLGEIMASFLLYTMARKDLPQIVRAATAPAGFMKSVFWYVCFCLFTLVNGVVYRLTAASLPPGSISLIEFSMVGFNAIYGLLLFGYAAVLPAYWAENAQTSDGRQFRTHALRFGTRLTALGGVLTVVIRLLIGTFEGRIGNTGWGQSHHFDVLSGFFSIHLVSLVPAVVTFAVARYLVVIGRSPRLIAPAVIATVFNVVGSRYAATHHGITGIGWCIVGYQVVLAALLLAAALRLPPGAPEKEGLR